MTATAFDWNKKASEEGQKQSPKLPEGQHRGVSISKILFGTKNGGPFRTQKGDPQILVIVSDNQEREASSMYTLTDAFGWAIAKLCDAAGLNLDKMTKSGITPAKFADETFASKNLVGRKLDVEVTHKDKYANFQPLRGSAAGGDDFSNDEEDDGIPV